MVAEGKTQVAEGHEDASFYIGGVKNPVAILEYNEIPEYLTEEFYSMYQIWNNSRLTNSLPISPVWGDNPQYLIDIISAFQQQYEFIVKG